MSKTALYTVKNTGLWDEDMKWYRNRNKCNLNPCWSSVFKTELNFTNENFKSNLLIQEFYLYAYYICKVRWH